MFNVHHQAVGERDMFKYITDGKSSFCSSSVLVFMHFVKIIITYL